MREPSARHHSRKSSVTIKYVLFLYFGFICLICMQAYVGVNIKNVLVSLILKVTEFLYNTLEILIHMRPGRFCF